MERASRYCFCSPGCPPWTARSADRYCGLCGKELLTVIPRAPLLAEGPPATFAVYLQPRNKVWTGTIGLELLGAPGQRAAIRWYPQSSSHIRIAGHRRLTPTLLELSLHAPCLNEAHAGWLGKVLMWIALHGQQFSLVAEVFGLRETLPRAWHSLQPGQEQTGRVLVLARETQQVRTFLHMEAVPNIPVQLDAIHCTHPAVTINLLHSGRARAPAVAEILWDPTRLLGTSEEVAFRLSARGLPSITLRQRVRRELSQPVQFQPGALIVDCLAEDDPQTRLVQLTNADLRPVVIRNVEPVADWMSGATLASALPLRLSPGASTTLRVDLHLQEINGVPPPYLGQVALDVVGHRHQLLPVRVETVRCPQRVAGPLLIDPGPPRIVLARIGEDGHRLIYLPCSGDAGIEPEELGLDRKTYAAAVYGLRPPQQILSYLLAAARARCRMRDLLDFASVRLYRPSWVPADFASLGVEVCDWVTAARERLTSASALLRLDLWNAYLVEPSSQAPGPLLDVAERAQSLGITLVRWLAQQFAENLKALNRRVPPELLETAAGRLAPELAWLCLACEALVLDCCWGPVYAWRRLRRAAWQSVPALGRVALGLSAAQRELVRAVADYAQQICLSLVQRRATEGASGLVVVGPLCRSPLLRGVLRSIFTSAGFEAEFAANGLADLLPGGPP